MKRFLFICLAVYGVYYYVSSRYTLHDAMVYASKHPDPEKSPKIEYYIGWYYYQRGDYPKAQEAFTQLLMEYPTCQYEASALFDLGDSAEENNDRGLAKASLARYMEHFPNGSDKDTVTKKLELLKYHYGPDIPPFPSREER